MRPKAWQVWQVWAGVESRPQRRWMARVPLIASDLWVLPLSADVSYDLANYPDLVALLGLFGTGQGRLARNTALVGLEAELELSRRASLSVGYQGAVGGGSRDHLVKAKLRCAF